MTTPGGHWARANSEQCRSFYNEAYQTPRYANVAEGRTHFAQDELVQFIDDYRLNDQRCLEVGCGRGYFQDVAVDYTGVDVSQSVRQTMHKPFICCDARELPFDADSFDAAWSITVLEHVPEPERALAEMRRVLKPGGVLLLKPAWHCRPWICEGIPVRPYADLTLPQRWVKATLPIRDSLLVRAAGVLPRRLWRLLGNIGSSRPRPLPFGRLMPDYKTFWMVDSDAAASLDPFDVIAWFRQRGDDVVSHTSWTSAVLSRSESVIVRVKAGDAHA